MSRPSIEWIAPRARAAGRDATMLARLTRDLPGYLRATIGLEDARDRMRDRLATREQRFLWLVQHGIYGRPASPYARLLRQAGCELGDFRALVAGEGIEGGLKILADRGVYVTFEELKGRRLAVRGSQRLRFRDLDFDNPLSPAHLSAYTGGSGGAPSRVGRSLSHIAEQAVSTALAFDAHDARDLSLLVWATAPVTKILTFARLDQMPEVWLYPVAPLPGRVRIASRYLAALGGLAGRRIPMPAFLDLQQPERLVAWLARQRRTGRRTMVTLTVSSAVRAAAAATAAGISLEHVIFYVHSEPMTRARHRYLVETGARVVVSYGTVEIMTAGFGCAAPMAVDEVHLAHDRLAAICLPREVSPGGPVVDALAFSTISRHASKIFLNADLGDYGRLEQRECGCGLERSGFPTHLSNVRSYEKLTGEGMTVVRTNLTSILEEILPERFGGNSTDYQLVEQEDVDGTTRMVLRVHASVGEVDHGAVRDTLLSELGRGSMVNSFMTSVWRRAGTVTVSREPPLVTRRGKMLPVHLLKAAVATEHRSAVST